MSNPKIFRLHTAASTGTHWHTTAKINQPEIDTIRDPADSAAQIPVTSIPSPFGRLHLVEAAFQQVNALSNNNPANLTGKSIHHRLVSETLDLAQLLFNMQTFKNGGLQIDVVRWEVEQRLAQLKAGSSAHKILADTLDLYIGQSPANSPLKNVKDFYIIRLNHRPIGASSPSTLFFSTPNDEHFTTNNPIKIGADQLFDHDYCPLYQRDEDFIRYLYTFFEANPSLKLPQGMPFLYTYLERNMSALAQHKNKLWNDINTLRGAGLAMAQAELNNKYELLNLGGPGSPMELLPNVYWYQSKAGSGVVESDFRLGNFRGGANEKFKGKNLPLVLQNGYGFPLNYWGNRWSHNQEVPYKDERPLEQRTLPGLVAQYPYMTVADFLQPHLLQLPYKLDDKHYFEGNPQGFEQGNVQRNQPPDPSYLLPLKRSFFEFFDAADLERSHADGRKVFEFQKLSPQSVKVILRLPLASAGHYVTLERIYHSQKAPKISETENEGSIVGAIVNVGIMPFLREAKDQRVGIIERDNENHSLNYEVEFFANHSAGPIAINQKTSRSSMAAGHDASSNYYQVNDPFDYLVLGKGDFQGVVLPRFPAWQEGMGNFTFAVDFGTTNTHIEYSLNGSAPQAFDIKADEIQLITMAHPDWPVTPLEIERYFLYEMIPFNIGEEGVSSEYSFPVRTALCEGNKISFHGSLLTYGDFNPALYFEQRKRLRQSIVTTELKWNNTVGNVEGQKRVTHYLESLMTLIRNKVLLKGGRLASTKLIWFYPASMNIFAMNQLRRDWAALFSRYFIGASPNQLIAYSESEAPFYDKAGELPSMQPVVNMDIGGGSTDIVIFKNNAPELYTSVKFAGNVLYGNAYDPNASLNNGFVKHFSKHAEVFLQTNYYSLIDLNELYDQFKDPGTASSANLISFLFSLENNKMIRDRNLKFSFTDLLQSDQDFKPVYYVFFSSLFYFLARTMKLAGLEMPAHILLTGNGSKNLGLLDLSPNSSIAAQLARAIFEHVYGQPYHSNGLQIHQTESPKRMTCQGGIKRASFNAPQQEPDNLIWLGDVKNTLSNDQPVRYQATRITYADAQGFYPDVVSEVRTFLDLIFLEIPKKVQVRNFALNLGKLPDYHQYMSINLDGYLNAGLQERLKSGASGADAFEETMFFYPLVGAIHRLALGLASNQI